MTHISASRGDDATSWMATLDELTDDELDALLHGAQPAGAESLAPLVHVVASLRERTLAQAAPPMAPALRARLVAPSAAIQALPLSGRWAGGRVIRSAAAVLLVAGLVGAGAARNALPDEVQNAVSSAAELVGIEVPRADEGSDAPGDHADRSDGTDVTNGSDRSEGTDRSAATTTDRARDEAGATPGGAMPADPGTPGDGERATPAVPPVESDRGVDPDPATPPPVSSGGNEGRPEPEPPRRPDDVTPGPPVDEPLTSDVVDVRPAPQRSDRAPK